MEDTRRCGWCKTDPVYLKYHDEEWGREVTDDAKMFEFLGTTICYAHLQAVGYINDHLSDCQYKHI